MRSCRCCVPIEDDPDAFIMSEPPRYAWLRNNDNNNLHASVCASDVETRPSGSNSNERRDIVASGMKRFEGIGKTSPPQPDVEQLSPRVLNVLGMNPVSDTPPIHSHPSSTCHPFPLLLVMNDSIVVYEILGRRLRSSATSSNLTIMLLAVCNSCYSRPTP
jgi:hypothetical protein